MTTKRKAAAISSGDEEPLDPSDELLFYCLGGGNEVGRSCHIIQYKGKTVMVRLHSIRFDSISKVPYSLWVWIKITDGWGYRCIA